MRNLLIFILTIPILVIPSIAVEITGVVQTLKEQPVEAAVILHRDSGRKTISDFNGFFTLEVPNGKKIVLEIIHPDYIEQEISISEKDFNKKIIIKLSPYIKQQEEVVVTALRYPESSASIPAAETVLSEESLQEKIVPNIAQGLQELPGVSNIGAGGFSLVPNIRGLARRRVLILIDNARITSDRRTGPSASFINPGYIKAIEVLRSPSSVFYGSDAMGGVVHILTKEASRQEGFGGEFSAKYGTINQEKGAGLSLNGWKKNTGYYFSFQGVSAENYSSPLGEVLMSDFTQGSLFGKVSHLTKKREIRFSFLGARGHDIGKPNQSSQTKPTWYPIESQNLVQLQWLEKQVGKEGEISFQIFFNPNYLETKKERLKEYKTSESLSKTQSQDYGLHLDYGKKISHDFRLKGGIDYFGRANANARNRDIFYSANGEVADIFEEMPYEGGERSDFGVFISADYKGIKGLDLVGGIRGDLIHLEAHPGGNSTLQESSQSALTGFLGGTWEVFPSVVTFANLARAYRAPSLSELFYTGITGRGFIISQSNLTPETSFNLDIGLKIIKKRIFVGFYAFYYVIDDMIERILLEDSIYTYGNINQGEIKGIELELEYHPLPRWVIFGNFFSFHGKSLELGGYLNDIPPSRLYIGTKFWLDQFSIEANATIQQKKSTPGPAEIELPGYERIGLKASYYISSSFQIYLVFDNVSNRTYIMRPDPDAVEEPGRNILLGLNFSF
ncbi:TonB-dependent receptor plug domain-containing protein [Acidobacteriota bacterium]